MKEVYINFIKENDPTDIFTVMADNDQEALHFIKMYSLQGYKFEI